MPELQNNLREHQPNEKVTQKYNTHTQTKNTVFSVTAHPL